MNFKSDRLTALMPLASLAMLDRIANWIERLVVAERRVALHLNWHVERMLRIYIAGMRIARFFGSVKHFGANGSNGIIASTKRFYIHVRYICILFYGKSKFFYPSEYISNIFLPGIYRKDM